MNKEFFEYLFVVLTYRNIKDIEQFLPQIKKYNAKVIVVDSFYSDEIKKKIKELAFQNGADFLSVENKGYGAGNNRGIEYAMNNYDFKYLVVCNPDISIKKLPENISDDYDGSILAPIIITSTGKKQNPYRVRENKLAEYLMYLGYKKNKNLFLYSGIALYKIAREFFNFVFNMNRTNFHKIAAAHGSFLIFSKKALSILGVPFDEKMFLFFEEALLSHETKKLSIPIYMTKEIVINHFEDGSMNEAKIDLRKELARSFIYYYEKLKTK